MPGPQGACGDVGRISEPGCTQVFALLMFVSGVARIAGPLLGGQLLRVTHRRGVFGALAEIGTVLVARLPPCARRYPWSGAGPAGRAW